MSLDAGSVFATLGGRFDRKGFVMFDDAMNRSHGRMTAMEGAILRSTTRGSTALRAMGTAAGFGAAGGVAALGVAVVDTIKKAGSFEAQLSELKATSGATKTELKSLEQQALKTGISSGFGAKKVAEAQTELAKGGLTVKQILGGALQGTLALAQAGSMDLADAATITANSLNLFGLEGKDAAHVADTLATAANATTADVSDFGMALSQGGAAAKAAGLSFDETMVALEALAKAGVKNSDAGTSLKTALIQLVSPTKQQTAAAKQAGISFLDQNGKMKSLVSIAGMLRDKTSDMTKAQRTALFSTLAGTDGLRTLLALYDAGPGKLGQYEAGLKKQGTASEVARQKMDNAAGANKRFHAAIEAGQIIIGRAALPVLAREAEHLTQILQRAAADGSLDRIAHGFAHIVEEGIHLGIAVGGALIDIGRVGVGVVKVVLDIVNAFGGFHTVGPLVLGAVAGLLAFRAVASITPGVLALAGAVRDLFLAFRAGGALFAAETFISMLNPVSALVGVFMAAGAAIAFLSTREGMEEGAAKRVAAAARDVAAAKRQQGQAVRDLANQELAAANAGLGARQADLDLAQAKSNLHHVAQTAGKDSREYQQALVQERQAAVNAAQAHHRAGDELRNLQQKQQAVVASGERRLQQQGKLIASLAVQAAAEQDQGRRAALIRRYHAAVGEGARIYDQVKAANQRATLAQINFQREMAGLGPISKRNQSDVAALAGILNKLPKKVETKLVTSDQAALGKIARLSQKLSAFGAQATVKRILANSKSAEDAVRRLQGYLNGLHDKQITVSVNEVVKKARGALGIRAAGHKTDGPEIALIGEGAAPEYVIPTEPAYRGRGIDLWLQAGQDLGVAGYKRGVRKAGKKKKKKHGGGRFVPAKRDPLSLPVDTFEHDADDAQQRYEQALTTLRGLQRDSKSKGKENRERRGKAKAKLPGQQKKVDDLKAVRDQRKREAHDARVYANRISEQEDLVEIARNDMELADKQDNEDNYQDALTRRRKALGSLKSLYLTALKHIPADSEFARTIQKALGQTLNDVQDLVNAKNEPEVDAGDPFALSDADQHRLDDIEAAIALAELTPDKGDDVSAVGALVGFREGVLGSLQSRGAPSAAIAQAARDVKQARDDLTALTTPDSSTGAADQSGDLQAQLDQAKRRAEVAEETARVASGALDVFRGAGDLGVAGGSAVPGVGGPAPSIVIQTLHPADPATLDAIGRASTAGMSLQGSVQSPREVLGV